MSEGKVIVRLDENTRIELEKYLVREGLHRYKVKLSQLATTIVKDWMKKPNLDKDIMIYGSADEPRTTRVTINLTREEEIKIYEMYVAEYIRNCKSPSALIYNVFLQFVNENCNSDTCR